MYTNYEVSVLDVLQRFNTGTPKSYLDIKAEFGVAVNSLILDGLSLRDFIADLQGNNYLCVCEDGTLRTRKFVLSALGKRALQYFTDRVACD